MSWRRVLRLKGRMKFRMKLQGGERDVAMTPNPEGRGDGAEWAR